MSRHYTRLRDFFTCYFHEDWGEEYNHDPVKAVSEFIADQPPEDVKETLAELEFLLNQNFTGEKLETILYPDLGCAYYPPSVGQTYQEWLTDVHDQIARHLGKGRYGYEPDEATPASMASTVRQKSHTVTSANQTPSLNTEHLFADFITRPLLTGVLCWFALGASSCFRISWVRLKDFSYENDFFSLSIHNDGWYYGFLIGVGAGLLWGILHTTKHDSSGRIITLATIAVLGFALMKLPISGRWGNTSYENSESSFSAIKNARATAVRFYQVSNYNVEIPSEKRNYTSRFKMSKQRIYIKFQLDLQHQAPGQRVDFKLDVLLRRYDSGQWVNDGWMHPTGYVDGNWTTSSLVDGWGLVKKGKYEADFYIDGKGMAMGTFEIY